MKKETNLEDIVMKEGTEFDSSKEKTVKSEEVLKPKRYLYDTKDQLLPGQKTIFADDFNEQKIKDEANDYMIQRLAIEKVLQEKENNRQKKMSLEDLEYVELVKRMKDLVLSQQEMQYEEKYGYKMDGQTKRRTKKLIERKWNTFPCSKFTVKQMQDALYESTLTSNTKSDKERAAAKAKGKKKDNESSQSMAPVEQVNKLVGGLGPIV